MNEFEHYEEQLNWKEFIANLIIKNTLFHCTVLVIAN
jgi:hypothetical protein